MASRLRALRRVRSAGAGDLRSPDGESGAAAPDAAGAGSGAAPGPAPDDPRARSQERRQALQRATILLMSLAAIALSARAIVGERGLLDAHRAQRELASLQGEVTKWRGWNAYLEKRIKSLREDPSAIEAIARERLDWVRPGEITFLFPNDPAQREPGDPGQVAPGEFMPTHPGEIDALVEGGAPAPAPPASPAPAAQAAPPAKH